MKICIVYKGVHVAPKQGFQKYVLSYYILALNPRYTEGGLHSNEIYNINIKQDILEKTNNRSTTFIPIPPE